jgi:hypothetical protein
MDLRGRESLRTVRGARPGAQRAVQERGDGRRGAAARQGVRPGALAQREARQSDQNIHLHTKAEKHGVVVSLSLSLSKFKSIFVEIFEDLEGEKHSRK